MRSALVVLLLVASCDDHRAATATTSSRTRANSADEIISAVRAAGLTSVSTNPDKFYWVNIIADEAGCRRAKGAIDSAPKAVDCVAVTCRTQAMPDGDLLLRIVRYEEEWVTPDPAKPIYFTKCKRE